MDILIKSFNRPYYLDRCIQSIIKFVVNSNYKIIILDDGTPQKFLDKLLDKYPDILIVKSDLYDYKSNYCDLGKKPEIMTIPIDFWIKGAKNASEYFILLEDDFWVNKEVDFSEMIRDAKQDKVVFLKLFWIGNPKLIQKKSEIKKSDYTLFEPNLYTRFPFLFYFIFYKFDRFKIRKTLKLLKIYTFNRYLSYYSIYSVAGVLFEKNYFLALWKNHKNSIDENLQLYNALKYKYKNKVVYAHSNEEIVTQGILSAATNQFKEFDGISSDMFLLNKVLNEAWFKGDFDSMVNFPKDLSMDLIEKIIINESIFNLNPEDWKKWVFHCKNQYQEFGCIVD